MIEDSFWIWFWLTVPGFVLSIISIFGNLAVWHYSTIDLSRLEDRAKDDKDEQNLTDNDPIPYHDSMIVIRIVRILAISSLCYSITWCLELIPSLFFKRDTCFNDTACTMIGFGIQLWSTVDSLIHSLIALCYIYLIFQITSKAIGNTKILFTRKYSFYICIFCLFLISFILSILPFFDFVVADSYGYFFNYQKNGKNYFCECWLSNKFEYVWLGIGSFALFLHLVALIVSCKFYCQTSQPHFQVITQILRPWLIFYGATRLPSIIVRYIQIARRYDKNEDTKTNVSYPWIVVTIIACSSIGIGNLIVYFRNKWSKIVFDKKIEQSSMMKTPLRKQSDARSTHIVTNINDTDTIEHLRRYSDVSDLTAINSGLDASLVSNMAPCTK